MKSLQEFTELFADQFDESEDVKFMSFTDYRNLDEWDSMIALSVIGMIDEEFDVALSADEIRKSNTIEDLYKLIISKK